MLLATVLLLRWQVQIYCEKAYSVNISIFSLNAPVMLLIFSVLSVCWSHANMQLAKLFQNTSYKTLDKNILLGFWNLNDN